MRVFVDSIRIGVGGGRTYSYNLLNACAHLDGFHQFDVIVLGSAEKQFSTLASDHLTILEESRRVPESGWKRVLWEQTVLPLIVRKYEPDVLLSMGSVDLFLTSRLSRVPTVVVVQINQPWMVPDLMPAGLRVVKWGMGLSRYTASHFLSVSETTREELGDVFGINAHRVSVVHHGGASDAFSPGARSMTETLSRYGLEAPYILSVSSVFTFKNYLRLVMAYDMLRSWLANPPRLLVVGAVKHRSYYNQIDELIERRGLSEHVRFLGHVAHDDLPAIYANAQAYVFPSLCETFGLTTLEAMACGVPVAASNASVMPEVCADAASYFNPHDPEDMAHAMLRILTDRGLRDRLVARGLSRAREFSWQETARLTVELLEEVAGR